jgi:hypothetical protein
METNAKKLDPRAAYCGLYCGACPVFIATRESGSLSADDGASLSCSGCRSDECAPWCLECSLKKCARKRGLAFCGECADYPCADYSGFRDAPPYPYHAECPGYLKDIAALGTAGWLMSMESKWTCPDCGRPASWWEKKCRACGIPMPGFDKP